MNVIANKTYLLDDAHKDSDVMKYCPCEKFVNKVTWHITEESSGKEAWPSGLRR